MSVHIASLENKHSTTSQACNRLDTQYKPIMQTFLNRMLNRGNENSGCGTSRSQKALHNQEIDGQGRYPKLPQKEIGSKIKTLRFL